MYTKHLAPAGELTVLHRTIDQLDLKGLLQDREETSERQRGITLPTKNSWIRHWMHNVTQRCYHSSSGVNRVFGLRKQ